MNLKWYITLGQKQKLKEPINCSLLNQKIGSYQIFALKIVFHFWSLEVLFFKTYIE